MIAIINAFVAVIVESSAIKGSIGRRGQMIFCCTIHSGGRIRAKQPVREMLHVATLFGVEGRGMLQQRGRSGVSSDISVCDCGVCSDHYDDNDDVGFNVAVITRSGITLFQTQEALIFAIPCGKLGNNALLFEYCSLFINMWRRGRAVVSVAVHRHTA